MGLLDSYDALSKAQDEYFDEVRNKWNDSVKKWRGISWKNEDIYAGDIHIDRRGLTVILTSPTEGEETLVSVCRQNSYACCGGFDKWINTIEETAVKNAEKE